MAKTRILTMKDFSLTEEQKVEYYALEKGWQKAVYMRKAMQAYALANNIAIPKRKRKPKKDPAAEEAEEKPEDAATPKNASELRADIRLYMDKKSYSAIKSQIDMATELDKKGDYVLSARERIAIHKDLAKYEAPQYRSSDSDQESKSSVTVEIKDYMFSDDEKAEELPDIQNEEYDEFEFLDEGDNAV